MRALQTVDIFTQVSPRVFANTPASECLRRNVPGSQWAFVRAMLSTGAGVQEGWASLMTSVQTGKTAFDHIYGHDWWEFLKRNPETSVIFDQAMRSFSTLMTPAVTASFDWSRFPVIADIGGGIGTQLVDILDAHPPCRGILFDQPHVIEKATPHARAEIIGGSFFESVPGGADAYVLRGVIHDWADTESLAILRNVRKAAKPQSRLLLVEQVMPETPESGLHNWMDLNMLTMVGGRERTVAEYRELLSVADFDLEEVVRVPTPSPLNILIGKPR